MKNKTILITGATGTIGNLVAKALSRAGVNIALHCNNSSDKAKTLKKDIEKLGGKAFIAQSDLQDPKEAEKLVATVVDKFGGLDILIHAASVFEKTPLGSVTEKDWDKMVDVNLKATFFVSQAAGMEMQRRGGKIILFSDVAAQRPYAGYLPYCIAKAGVDCLIQGLAKALAPKVQVNGIAPYIVTRPDGITEKGWDELLAKIPSGKPSKPEEISMIVKMIIESGESLTGQIIAIDGGRLLR